MRRLTIDSALQKMVSRISALPSLPSVYTEMVDALRNEDVGIDQIGKIVAKDIGMMTKVLQLVNSAFFGLPRKVGHPTEAVNYLGLDTIRALVLSIGVFSQFSGRDIGAFSLQRLWDHSMTVGLYAKMIALNETQNTRLADSAFLAGIFHDVGKLVLASELPGEYGEILENVHASGIPDWKMERSRLGTDHAALGAYLLGLWGMDDLITEAVGFHHTPETGAAGESFTPLTAVSAADAISIASVICFSDHLDHSKSPEEHSGSEWHEMDRDIETLIGSNCGKWTEICRRLSEENKASA